MNKDIYGFMETQIKPSHSTCKIIEALNLSDINFDKNEKLIFKFSLRMLERCCCFK